MLESEDVVIIHAELRHIIFRVQPGSLTVFLLVTINESVYSQQGHQHNCRLFTVYFDAKNL